MNRRISDKMGKRHGRYYRYDQQFRSIGILMRRRDRSERAIKSDAIVLAADVLANGITVKNRREWNKLRNRLRKTVPDLTFGPDGLPTAWRNGDLHFDRIQVSTEQARARVARWDGVEAQDPLAGWAGYDLADQLHNLSVHLYGWRVRCIDRAFGLVEDPRIRTLWAGSPPRIIMRWRLATGEKLRFNPDEEWVRSDEDA